MTFEEYKKFRDAFESDRKAASETLEQYPLLANGLTPDAVKFSPAYRLHKHIYDYAHNAERAFHGKYAKLFSKEIRAEIAARRQAKLAAQGK